MNIFGKYFDDNEKVLKSLTKIYGVGRTTAKEIGMTFGIGSDNKVKDLSKETWSRIVQAIELGPKKYHVAVRFLPQNGLNTLDTKTIIINKKLKQNLCENRAITTIRDNIDLAKKIKSYKGLRHIEGLPCRGQRTHTNAITARKKGM